MAVLLTPKIEERGREGDRERMDHMNMIPVAAWRLRGASKPRSAESPASVGLFMQAPALF